VPHCHGLIERGMSAGLSEVPVKRCEDYYALELSMHVAMPRLTCDQVWESSRGGWELRVGMKGSTLIIEGRTH
jgi:hypothetical protein